MSIKPGIRTNQGAHVTDMKSVHYLILCTHIDEGKAELLWWYCYDNTASSRITLLTASHSGVKFGVTCITSNYCQNYDQMRRYADTITGIEHDKTSRNLSLHMISFTLRTRWQSFEWRHFRDVVHAVRSRSLVSHWIEFLAWELKIFISNMTYSLQNIFPNHLTGFWEY